MKELFDPLVDLLMNPVLLSAILGWMVAQTSKVIISIIKTKSFDPERLHGAGGMPSSHSCMVTAMTVATAMTAGVDSPIFAIAVIFSFVTLYDAMGVRWQAGLHAKTLNKVMRQTQKLWEIEDMRDGKQDEESEEIQDLKEFIGHRPMEVLVGVLIGIVIAVSVCMLMPTGA